MSEVIGETTRILDRLAASDDSRAAGDLIAHACDRLRCLARRMLRDDFSRLRRWEQTDDVLQIALLRLHRALEQTPVRNSVHFHKLAAQHVRWVLHDLLRHHFGPQGQAANHKTGSSGAADDPGGPLSGRPATTAEPSSAAEWSEFLERAQSLPAEEREVFDLLWIQGQTQEQAATALDVSLRTVKRRWQSARLWLQGIC